MEKYTTATLIKHNGKTYEAASSIELSELEAQELLALKAIKNKGKETGNGEASKADKGAKGSSSEPKTYAEMNAAEQKAYVDTIKDVQALEALLIESKSSIKGYIEKKIKELK